MPGVTVRPLETGDHAEWRPLFAAYAAFYGVALPEGAPDRVWAWLMDPGHVLEGLIARERQGGAVGIAHVRGCPRTLSGGEIGFLDDLYVTPEARGGGAADALFAALAELAASRGWATVRWLTQEFNYRGRAFYDRYTGGRSDFVLYQWSQLPAS